MAQAAVKDTTGYVNYVYNISARGTTEVASQLLGLSGMATNILGQLAFQTSSYLSTTEGALLSMGVIATAGFTKATQQAMEFDQALSTVGAISGKTRDEVSSLGDDAMAMSSKFGVAVSEMTQGMESLARAGVSQNNMTAILEEAMGLSKLEGLTLDTAINDLISTTNLLDTQNLDLSSSEYADAVRYQNQKITATSEAAPINAQDIIHTLEHIGGYASSTNLDQDDLYAVIAQLGSKGTKSEMAGTSLRAFISAGQKDTAQRALDRIGLSVKDLWKNDDTIMSISDMKDVLDEAMESRGYTQQEKLEFYSDFAGYKQANQIMKIDTSSVREFKEKIDHSWNMGQKINQVIGTAETHVQGLVQAGTNLLTKVGEPFLPIISTIAWTLRTGIDIINAIPGSNLIIAGGLILASVKAISTIFNKIVPQIVAAKGNIGSMGGFFDSIKRDLKESYTIIKNINNTDWIQRQAHSNEVNHITDDEKIRYWQHRTGKRLYGMTDVYRLEKRHGFTNDQHYIDWKKRENYRTKESRNERHRTQNEPTGATESSNNRKDNKKSDCCDSIIQVMKEGFVNQIYNTNTIKDRVSDIYGILSNSIIDKSVIDDLKTNVFSVYVTNIGDGGFSGGGSGGSQSNTSPQGPKLVDATGSDTRTTSTPSTKSKPKSSTKLLTNGVLDQSKIDGFIDNLDIDFGFDQSTVAGRESQKLMLNYAKDILRDNFRNNRNKLTGQSEEQLKKRIDREIKESIGPAAAHKLPSILASDPNIKTYSSSDLDKMIAYPTIDYDPSLKSSNDVLSELNLDYTRLTRGDNALKGGQEYLTALASLGNVDISNVKQNRNFRSNVAKQIAEDLKSGKNKDDIYSAKAVLDNVLTNRVAYHYINDLNDSDRKKFMESVGLKQTENPYVDMANYINANLDGGGKFVNKPEHLDLIHDIGNIAYLDKDKLKVTGGFSSYGNFPNSQSVKNEISAGTEKAIKMLGETGYYGIANHIKKITDAIVELAIQEDIEETRKEMEKELGRKVSTSEVIRSMPSLAQPNRFKWKPNDYDDIGKVSPDSLDLGSTIFNAAQQMHNDSIGGGEKYKNSTKGSKYAQLERTKLVQSDKDEDFIYFEKEMNELKNMEYMRALNFLELEEYRGGHEDIGPHKVGGNNTGIKTVGVSEIEALPFMFEGEQIKGVFRRKATHGRDMANTAVVRKIDGKDQLLGYLPNDTGKYHEAYSEALQHKRNREALQRNQEKIFGHIALNYGLSRQEIMDMPITKSQEDRIKALYNQQDFVDIEQYKKHYQNLYDAATPEQRQNMMTGEQALKQLRGQMAAARKLEIVKDKETGEEAIIDNGSMFEIEVTPKEYQRRKDANLIYTDEGNQGILKTRQDKEGNVYYTINDFEALHYSKKDLTRKVILEDVLRAKELEKQANILTAPNVENFGDWYDSDITNTMLDPAVAYHLDNFSSIYNIDPETMDIFKNIVTSEIDETKENMSQYDIVKQMSPNDVAEKILAAPENQIGALMNAIYLFDQQLYEQVIGSLANLYNNAEQNIEKMENKKEEVIDELSRFDQALDLIYGIAPDFIDSMSSQEKSMYMEMVQGLDNPVSNLLAIAQSKGYSLNEQYNAGADMYLESDFIEIMNPDEAEKTQSVADVITQEEREQFASDPTYDTRGLVSSVGQQSDDTADRMHKIKKALQTEIKEDVLDEYERIQEYFNPTQEHFESDIVSGGLNGQALNIIAGLKNIPKYYDPNLVWKETTPGGDEEPTIIDWENQRVDNIYSDLNGQAMLEAIDPFTIAKLMPELPASVYQDMYNDFIEDYFKDVGHNKWIDPDWYDAFYEPLMNVLDAENSSTSISEILLNYKPMWNMHSDKSAEILKQKRKDLLNSISETTNNESKTVIDLSDDEDYKKAVGVGPSQNIPIPAGDEPILNKAASMPGGISGVDYSTIRLVNETLDTNLRSIGGYQSAGQLKETIQQKLNDFISPKVDRLYGRFGNGDNSKVTERLGGWSDKLTDATDTLQGFSVYLQEASELFPPLSVAVLGLEGVITTVTKINEGTQALSSFLSIGDRLKGGDEIEILGKVFSSDNNAGKMLMSATGMVGEAVETLTTIFWEFLGPIALITAGLVAIKGALDWSYQSHQKYLKSLEEDQKEHRSKVKGLQATNENAQEQARNNRAPRQQAALDRNAQLAQTRLDNANMTRSHGAIEITRQKNDTLWGDYGIAAGLGKLQGNYESTASEYDGTSGQIRRIKEATLANPFSSDAMNQVSSYYDANQLAFGVMDEYKDELGKLYDSETSAMLKYHSDDVRGSPEFNKALDDFVEATGITRDHAKQYLDYMQTEHEVDKATQAMQAQADQISANTELKVQAIAFGGNPADVLGLNGIEAQQGAMIKAQADMIKMELSGQLWWKAVWATITTPIKLILSPLFIITDLLSAIWSFMTGNWGDAFDKAGKAGSRLNVFGEAATYWGAWAETEGTDFSAIGQSATDSYNRANYGNVEQPASGGYHPTHYLDANQGQDRREAFTHYTNANRGSYHFMNAGGPGEGGSGIQFNPLGTITGLLSSILGVLVNGLLIGGGIYGIYKLIKSDFNFKDLGAGILSTIKGEGSNLLYDVFNVDGISGKATDILGKFFNIDGIKKRVGGISGPATENENGELTRYGQLVKAKEDFLGKNAWGSYLGEKLMPDDFNNKKRKGMNASDREYLNKRYGLGIDFDERDEKGRRKYRTADQKNKAVRQALDDKGQWDDAVLDLHNNRYVGDSLKKRAMGVVDDYANPWKEYLGGKVDEKKTQAQEYWKNLQVDAAAYYERPDLFEDASSPVKAMAKAYEIKDQIFGKASKTDFSGLLNDPKKFLSDPRNIENMAKDLYAQHKDKLADSDFMATVGAYRERPDIMEDTPIHAKLMGKALDWKDKYLQGDSIQDVLKDPERTVDILQGTWKDLQGGALDDLNIGETVKDKVSGFFNDIKEGAEEGIDDDEEGGNGGLIERAKKKLAGFFGFGKEDTSPITKEEMEENEAKGDFQTIPEWKKQKLEEIQSPSLGQRIKDKLGFGGKEASEETPMSNIGKMMNMDVEGKDALAKSGLLNGHKMGVGDAFIESSPGAANASASILPLGEEESILPDISGEDISKGGKGLSKIGKSLSGKGGKLGKVGNVMSKVGGGMSKAGSKGLGGIAKGGIGKLAKTGIGKAGSKVVGKIGSKLAAKGLSQVGSKVLGGALIASGIGAPLGLLLESPLGGPIIEGVMSIGGSILGGIGGAIGGVGEAIGGIFGFGKKGGTHYQKAGGGGMNPLGMMMPGIGLAGAIAGGIGSLFGGNTHNMGAAGNAGLMKMVNPLAMGVGLLGSIFKNNRDHKNQSTSIGDLAKKILKNLIDGNKEKSNNNSSGGNITIQNININTADDPEAIKAMFLELLIELQEQVNPRIVSRTVGEAPANSTTSTDTTTNTPTDTSTDTTNGTNTTNGTDTNSTNTS